MSTSLENFFDKYDLLKEIRRQHWFAQHNVEFLSEEFGIDETNLNDCVSENVGSKNNGSIKVLDWLLIPHSDCSQSPQCQFYWMMVEIASTHRYSILVNCLKGGIQDASLATCFIEQVKRAGEDGLKTAKDAIISLYGDITKEEIVSITPFEAGSSNTLQRCTTRNNYYVIKSYRLMVAKNKNEVNVLTALSQYDLTPAMAGRVAYYTPATKTVEYLCVLTEYLKDLPVHKLYSKSIRTTIESLNADPDNILPIKEETQKVRSLSAQVGQQIRRFHNHLNKSFKEELQHANQRFELSIYLEQNLKYWNSVYNAVEKDAHLTDSCRKKVLLQLKRCKTQLLQIPESSLQNKLPVSIAHGDLHLAHIFIDERSHQRCRIIDPSPVSLDSTDEFFSAQLSLMDLVDIHRGIEYFSFDEIVDAISRQLDKPAVDIASMLLQEPDTLSQASPPLYALLGNWSSGAITQLLDAYDDVDSALAEKDQPGERLHYRIFYFGRLLRELEYNYAYGRHFFKLCDLFYLTRLVDDLNTCEY